MPINFLSKTLNSSFGRSLAGGTAGAAIGAGYNLSQTWGNQGYQSGDSGSMLGRVLGGAMIGAGAARYGGAAWQGMRKAGPIFGRNAFNQAVGGAAGLRGNASLAAMYGKAAGVGIAAQAKRDWRGATLLANQGLGKLYGLGGRALGMRVGPGA